MAQGPVAKARVEKRRALVENLMARMVRKRQVERRVCDEFGCSTRTVRGDMKAIADRWAREATERDRDDVREELEAGMREMVQAGWAAREIVRDAQGQPVRDANGKVVTIPTPNFSAIARGLDQLAKLHGCYSIKLDVEVQTQIEAMLEQVRQYMPQEAYDSFIRALARVQGLESLGVLDVAARPSERH